MGGSDFGDLVSYVDPEEDRLTLPVGGKKYTLPPVSAELAIWCKAMDVATRAAHSADTEEERQAARERFQALSVPKFAGREDITFEEVMLGDEVYGQMVADGVPYRWIELCARTACLKIVYSERVAKEFWEAGGDFPEAAGPSNRAERRARSTSTGAAPATPSPASTSGTSSRKRSGRRGQGNRKRGTRS